jgi:hypothetical protein
MFVAGTVLDQRSLIALSYCMHVCAVSIYFGFSNHR